MPDNQRVRTVRIIDTKLSRDDAAERVPAHDRTIDLKDIHKTTNIPREVGDRPGFWWIIRPAGAAPIKDHDLKELGEIGHLKWHPRQQGMPLQDQRCSHTGGLIEQSDTAGIRIRHGFAPSPLRATLTPYPLSQFVGRGVFMQTL